MIRGFDQQFRIDYKHTFSPPTKLATVRVVIALVVSYGWDLQQLDVNNAFFHWFTDEKIYIFSPLGYNKALPGQVCKLIKSL